MKIVALHRTSRAENELCEFFILLSKEFCTDNIDILNDIYVQKKENCKKYLIKHSDNTDKKYIFIYQSVK